MNKNLLEVCEFLDPGYRPVIDFGEWRVAILNYLDELHPEQIAKMERHNETDEVFVMLKGRGIIFVGEGDKNIIRIHVQVLEYGKIYNVKRSVWHAVVLSRDGSVLIVENRNTSPENSRYALLDPEQRHLIISASQSELSRRNGLPPRTKKFLNGRG